MTFAAWLATIQGVLLHPAQTFRAMRLDGSALPPFLFLLSIAVLVGVGWGVFALTGLGRPPFLSWVLGMVAAKTVLVMTYIETVGVTFFSRRRGWRVPFGLAERLTCYASVGWVIAAVVFAGLMLLDRAGIFKTVVLATVGHWTPAARMILAVMAFGAAVMGFELLVWTGVRQIRFANRPPPPEAAPKSPPELPPESPPEASAAILAASDNLGDADSVQHGAAEPAKPAAPPAHKG